MVGNFSCQIFLLIFNKEKYTFEQTERPISAPTGAGNRSGGSAVSGQVAF